MSVPAQRHYTTEEYLAFEREAEIRHEYCNGEIFAMSGGTREHSLIAGNLVTALNIRLNGTSCEVHGSDMRVKVNRTGLYTYPDVSIVCGEPLFEDGRKDTLLNPLVVFEVLSQKTARYDRGAKFAHYQNNPSIQE